MTPRDEHATGIIATALVLFAVAVALALWAGPAAGQGRTSLTDLRLRMLVAEVEFTTRPDPAAILHAIDRLARRSGRTVADAIHRHTDAYRVGRPAGRRWVAAVNQGCTRPPALTPGTWSGARQHGCVRLVHMIRRHAAGKLPDPCHGEPDQWRSRRRPDLQRAAARRGWRRVGCGRRTLHVFWDTGKRL